MAHVSEPLRPHDLMALRFLSLGPDTIGVIESEEQLAAALVYIDLAKRDLVVHDAEDGVMTASITHAGLVALSAYPAATSGGGGEHG